MHVDRLEDETGRLPTEDEMAGYQLVHWMRTRKQPASARGGSMMRRLQRSGQRGAVARRGCTQAAPTLWRAWPGDARIAVRGYTLLELLIVGVLVSVLMAGVWSLLRNWSGLYARGEQRVQHMQLVRSLCDQFTDDVHAAAQAAVPDTNHSTPQSAQRRSRNRRTASSFRRSPRPWWAVPTG